MNNYFFTNSFEARWSDSSLLHQQGKVVAKASFFKGNVLNKLWLLGILLVLAGQSVFAQTFTAAGTPAAIPDNNPTGTSVTVAVAGLGGTVASANEVQLNLNLTHTWVGDLIVGITPPGGTEILILNRAGTASVVGSNNNCVTGNTLSFRQNASGVMPTTSTTTDIVPAGIYLPTNNTFIPNTVGSFSSLIGATRDGNWTIRVSDNAGADVGTIDIASITFTPPPVATNNVTFCVDYTCVAGTPGFAAQQIQFEDGPFTGFQPLTQTPGTNIWCATFALPVGSTVRYNFFYAGAAGAGGPENLAGATACTTTGKRTLTVAAGAPQSVTFAWESCAATPVCPVVTNNVTFCVDYTCVAGTPGFAAQQIQFEDGPFAGFRPLTQTPGTNIWCATFALPVGSTVRYNFFYAGAAGAGGPENLAGATACTTTGKRTLTVAAGAPQSVTFAWESCSATPVCPVVTNNVTFCVDYTCVAGAPGFAAQQIQFEDGPFAGFRPLTQTPGTNIWCATFALPVGSTVRYNFFYAAAAGAGGPENLAGATACTTTGKRTLTVAAGAPQSVTFAWESCSATPVCPVVTNNVTFCVDYTCVAGAPGFAAQQIQFEDGPFAGFRPLTQTPGTNIWCATFALPVGSTVRYNFFYAAAAGAGGPENLAGATACTTTGKRTLTVAAGPPAQTVTFAWESCVATAVCPAKPALKLTFEDPATVTNYNLVDFGGAVSSIIIDPTNAANKVVQVIKTTGAATFAGTVLGNAGLATPIPFTATQQTMVARVWAPAAGIPVLLKIERTTGGPTAEVLATTTTAGWQILSWNMSTSTTQPWSLANTYDKIVIFFNFGAAGTNQTFYVDDVAFCGTVISPPTAAAAQSFCILPVPTVASLVASLVPTGTSIQWFAAATGGVALAPTTVLVNGTTYYASQSDMCGCQSSLRTPVTVTLNASCFMGDQGTAGSTGTGAFTPIDPCTCNNNSSPITQDNGTFNEFIQVMGPSGAVVTATAIGGTPSALTFTEVPIVGMPGMSKYNSIVFTHVDNIGYTANLFANTLPATAPPFSIGSIGNKCAYPNVAIDPKGPFNNCLGQANVPLTATVTNAATGGVFTWGGIGVTGSNFNPSGLPVGNVATTLSFDGNFINSQSLDNGITAAFPGCIQAAVPSNITITECCVDLGVTITKTVGAVHYDQCVNPEEVIVDVTIRLVNTSGRVLNNVYLDEVLNTVPGAFLGLATYPNGILTDADVVPQLNYSWNGTTNPSLFTNTSGVLGIGDFIEVTLSLKFNADLLLIPVIANTASGGGTYMNIGSTCVATGVNATPIDFCPFILLSPPADITVNACESYDNEIQHWLATYAGATFSNACREVEIICNDYCAPHAWQYLDNCSKNAILPVRFTVKYTDGSTFEFCSVINKIDPQVVTFLTPPQDLVLNCSGNNQAAQVQAWLNDNGGAIAQLCEGYIYHSNNYSGALPIGCNSSVPVTFTITNECGLSTSAVANISLIDNTPPLLSGLPANTTINCGDAIPAAPTVTATDACTPNVAVNLSQWVATISGNLSGANEVPANNSSASGRVFAQLTGNSLQIVVAFNGLTAPASAAHIHEAAAGANGPVRIDLVGLGFPVGATNGVFTTSVTLTAALQAALAAGNLYVNIHNPSFPGGELRAQLRSQCTNTTVRVWSASDACNNSAIAMRTISETDTQAPTFTSVPASTIIACNGTVVLGTATATDACSAATVTFSDVTTGTVCTGVTTTRTFRATDGCGNTATAVQSVTKSADTAAPTFTFVPANNTFACGGTPFLGTATATDACSSVTVTFVDSQGAGNCSGASSIRTFRATDGCGNSATATQESTPEVDVVPPTFGPLTEVIEIVCGDAVVFETATTSDNCTAVTVAFTDEVNGDVCAGIMNIRYFTATDACGNTATAKQTVWQIGDTTDPEYTNMLEDEAVYFCGETPDYDGVGAVDGCGGDVTVSYEIDYDYEDYCYDGYGYYSKVRYTAVDACGNENHETITSHFVPEDHRMAFMYKPVSKTVTCSEAYTFDAVYPKVVSYDGAISSVTYTDIANLTPCGSGTITRRWTATDVVGNSAIAEQTVTILPDTELPTLVLANNSVVVSCATAITVQAPLVSDNCSTSDAITLTYTDVNVENTIQRTWSAADACGNVANATQIYIILDTQAPVFTTALQNKTINCGAPVIFDNAVAADACSAVTMSYADTQLAINCGTEHTRTWTASDAVGNASTILQKITVVDNAAPIFSYVPANVQVASANLVSFGTPQVADVCQIVQLTFSDVQTTPICANTGYTVTRTWVANDGCNNQAVASQQISVALDAQAPVFSATLVDQTIAFGEQVVFTTLTATDNNGTPTLTYQDVQGAPVCGNSGYTVTRTWTAMDACNNAAEAVQHISVGLDVEAPVFASLLESKTIDCGGLIAFDNPVVTDNSSNFALTYTDAQTTPTCGNSGYTMTRTYTALDVCNNAAQVAQSIYVAEDTEAPVFVGTVNDMEMTQYAFSTWVPMAPAAADNCQALEVLIGTAINVDACNYKVDYTATDACGNFVIRTQNIHIVDCLVLGTNEGVLSSVNIYPNPTETELNIVMSSEVDLKDITAQVFDMLGKQVAMTQVTQHQSNINVSTLAAGTYTLRLTAEGGVKSVKFVKQ